MRRPIGRFCRMPQISLISDSTVSTTSTPVIATKMIDGPTTLAAPSASTTTYSWTIADADAGSRWRSRKVSSTLRKSWKTGNCATNANATVASGTNPSSVDEGQAAGRAKPADAVHAGDDAADEADGTQGGLRQEDRAVHDMRLSQT